MKHYHKIETLFNRSMEGDKHLINGSFRKASFEMLADAPIWKFYEKYDGSNHAIEWDGHHISLHGRTNKSVIPERITSYYNEKFNNNETEELFEQLFGEANVILYFEAIGPKIQACGAKYCDNIRFILLDVYYVGSDSFSSYEDLQRIAKAFNVDIKQCVGSGSLYDAIKFIQTNPYSIYAKYKLPMEGVVCVPSTELKDGRTDERIIVKIKYCDFK